jgi:hypothetical protein
MNRTSIATGIILLFFVGTAIWLITEVLLSRTSSVGELYLYVTIAAGIVALVRPVFAVYIILPLTCYIDFFKRLMVIGGYPTQLEVAYIMALPLALILGAVGGQLLSVLVGRVRLGRTGIVTFVIATVVLFLSVLAMSEVIGIRTLGIGLNEGGYAYLLFLVPQVLDTPEKRRRYMGWTIVFFVPVALYMIKQFYFGLADFEYAYLEAGLSQELRILLEFGGEAPRYFSTMSGAATVSTMLSLMVLPALAPIMGDGRKARAGRYVAGAIAAILFTVAAAMTVSRGGWVCGACAIVAYILFGGRRRTTIFYVMAVSVFLITAYSSDYLIKYRLLDEWQQDLSTAVLSKSGGANVERAIILGTMYDRLSGWRNLLDPTIFPPFGTLFGGEIKYTARDELLLGHDMLTNWMGRLGWFPMLLLIAALGLFVVRMHRFQFGLDRQSLDFRIVRMSLALAAGMLVGGLANSAQLAAFPQNFYFYLWVAFVLGTYLERRQQATQSGTGEEDVGAVADAAGFPRPAAAGMASHKAARRAADG